MKQGVLYLVVNDLKYSEYMNTSIDSLRKSNYSGDIHVLTNLPLEERKDISYQQIEVSAGRESIRISRDIKTQLNKYTPFERTLFLDCDTLILNDISKIWEFADKGNFLLARDSKPTLGDVTPIDIRFRTDELLHTHLSTESITPYYSSSTILWNTCEESTKIFQEWHTEWLKFKFTDQMSLARALANKKIEELSHIYNCPTTKYDSYKEAQEAGIVVYAIWGDKRDYHFNEYNKPRSFNV